MISKNTISSLKTKHIMVKIIKERSERSSMNFNNYHAQRAGDRLTESICNIPSHSNILIGGYLTNCVPNFLISALAKAECHSLTIITNASVINNSYLRNLLRMDGKVNRLITSLMYNKFISFDRELIESNKIELSLLDPKKFIQDYCYQNLALSDNKNNGQYSLIKSDFVDENKNLLWRSSSNTFFNDSFAKSALIYSIAQAECVVEARQNMHQLNKIFVEKTYLISQRPEGQEKLEFDNDAYDLITKRVLLELENQTNVYLTFKLKNIIERFYKPKHLKLNYLNSDLEECWPSNTELFNYIKKLDLCVVDLKNVNHNGEIEFDCANKNDCFEIDIVNNLNKNAKLIAILNDNLAGNECNKNTLVALKRKPDLIITNRGVFKYNNRLGCYELTEYASVDNYNQVKANEIHSYLQTLSFQTHIDQYRIKNMAQQCI